MESTVERYKKLDVLHNNAGTLFRRAITETNKEEWEYVIDVNLKGVFLCCKYAIPIMKKQGGGSIINTASTFAFVGASEYSAYCASKGGVVALTRAIALEVAPYNIRVNCICPGTIMTSQVERVWEATGKPEEMRKIRLGMHPIGRLGRPEDVAYAALYLASDESSFITGSALFVDGGYTAH
jgi:NAD(P)-dependent dehydrogenase (short-subunit alcohol dehydrogenase family)